MGQDPDAIRQDIAQTRAEMSDTVEAIGYKADVPARAREKVSEKVDAAKARVSEATTRAKEAVAGSTAGASDRAGGVAARVGDATPSGEQVRRQARRAVGLAQENPLGLAIGAAAVGFLAGLVVPSTRVEDERLGPVADQVRQQARETGQEALERGRQVAQEAASSATDAAREHGQDLAQSAKQRTQEVREEVRDQAP
jgi:vacuolar-type H+-ATPase subunit H